MGGLFASRSLDVLASTSGTIAGSTYLPARLIEARAASETWWTRLLEGDLWHGAEGKLVRHGYE